MIYKVCAKTVVRPSPRTPHPLKNKIEMNKTHEIENKEKSDVMCKSPSRATECWARQVVGASGWGGDYLFFRDSGLSCVYRCFTTLFIDYLFRIIFWIKLRAVIWPGGQGVLNKCLTIAGICGWTFKFIFWTKERKKKTMWDWGWGSRGLEGEEQIECREKTSWLD